MNAPNETASHRATALGPVPSLFSLINLLILI